MILFRWAPCLFQCGLTTVPVAHDPFRCLQVQKGKEHIKFGGGRGMPTLKPKRERERELEFKNLLEMFGCDFSFLSKVLVHQNQNGGNDTEKETKTKHN